MIDDLKPLLQGLPEPAPPSSITATVMARIARDVEQREGARAALPQRPRERPVWLLAFAGAAIVLMVAMRVWFSTEVITYYMASEIGFPRLPRMPLMDPISAVLAIGLLVYLAGLFAPLRTRARDQGRRI